ncbi:MAG: penicillin-binding protein activator LpoB [Planctomycetes bacterium]|nr:penicillin-binding protein activator LpoB [Planctomycetota bacterium]
MKAKILIILLLSSIFFVGCAQETVNIDVMHDEGKAVMALDYRDFDQAASGMIQSMLGSGALKKDDGSRYVVATARIINDTMQRIDTNQLMAKIEEELLNSGQVVMTSAVGGKGAPDEMVYQVRDIRDSAQGDEFNQDTIAAKGQLVAPELSISGKIFQRNIRYDKNRQQVEYYFQLKITDLTTGLRFWQKETVIGKRGSNKSVAW